MEIDVSDWTVIRDEPGGRDKNKRWIAEDADAPRDQHWLWKYRQTTGDGSEAALTDCAEVFTSRLADAIDLPAAECRFAILDGDLGLISRNVTPHGFNLNTGSTYLPEVEGYQRCRPPALRPMVVACDSTRATRSTPWSRSSGMSGRHRESRISQGSLSSRATSCSMPWSGTVIGIQAIGRSWSVRATARASSPRPTTMAAPWAPA